MVEFTIICQGSECDDTDCPSCSTFCDGCTLLEPTCPGLSQKRGNRWREWHVDENYGVCENEACCASDEEDCCETNVGAIVGLVIALVVVIGGSIYAYRKYKGGKIKGPDEEARHGDSSEPDVAPQRAAEPETEVDPLTVPCPSCRSRVVHNSGEGKDAFFKCSSCSRYLTYHVLCELPRSQAEARVL